MLKTSRLHRHYGLLFVLIAIWPFSVERAHGQTTVSGTVHEPDGEAVAVANVRILTAADSSLVAGTLTDDDGAFAFEAIDAGTYLLYVSLIGYEDALTDLRLDGRASRDLGVIRLRPTTLGMDEVVVSARRTLIEQKPDRLVINVASSVTSAGRSALEVLARSPGVVVDHRSGTVSLTGKEGVNVMVNGRTRYVPADGLVDFLSGLRADNIERIELITSPPASFEAEGNAGFINIVLKESTGAGLNGAVGLSGGLGFGRRANGNANVTYDRRRLTVHGTYSGGLVLNQEQAFMYRCLAAGESVVETPTSLDREPVTHRHDARLAVEWALDDKTSVGGIASAYSRLWDLDAVNRTVVRRGDVDVTQVRSDKNEIHRTQHLLGNLHLDRDIGDEASLGADLDLAYYYDHNPTEYRNLTTDLANASVSRDRIESEKRTPLRILAAEADYAASPAEHVEVAAGVKSAFSAFKNTTGYQGAEVSQLIRDLGVTSGSSMTEDILAAYSEVIVKPDTLTTLRAGLRYELTDMDLQSNEGEPIVDRRYGSFFPSIAYSRVLGGRRTVNASYTRRVTRPSFRNLALALYFYDPYAVLMGNPALRHAIVNMLKLDFSVGDLLTSVQYAWEDHSIAPFQNRIDPEQNFQVVLPENIRGRHQLIGMLAFPFQLTDWWTSQNSLTARWEQVSGFSSETEVSHDRPSFRLTATQNLSLPFDLDLEVSGYYQSAMLLGLMTQEPAWIVDLGLRRPFHGGRGALTLTLNNVFDSGSIAAYQGSRREPIYLYWDWKAARRYVQLTYSLRFGDGKTGQMRSTASQEERRRAGG